MIVRTQIERRPAEAPRTSRELVVETDSYEDGVAQIDAQLGDSERVMFYRVDDAAARWRPQR